MTQDEFDEKVKAAAEEYDQHEHCDLEIAFSAGAAKARELMMGEIENLKDDIEELKLHVALTNNNWNLMVEENNKLNADLALAVEIIDCLCSETNARNCPAHQV